MLSIYRCYISDTSSMNRDTNAQEICANLTNVHISHLICEINSDNFRQNQPLILIVSYNLQKL